MLFSLVTRLPIRAKMPLVMPKKFYSAFRLSKCLFSRSDVMIATRPSSLMSFWLKLSFYRLVFLLSILAISLQPPFFKEFCEMSSLRIF